MAKKVYLIHGWGGNDSSEGWFGWLKENLKEKGIEVIGFNMPNTDEPKIEEWLGFMKENIKNIDEETYFLGHSIGCQAILRFLEGLDNDETDPTGPTELVNDGFEVGLGDWVVSGSGALWLQESDLPYEGTYSARAKKSGADLPTYMETSFDASGFSTVTFEYYRRLIGLDTVDDFAAEYFDGTWNAVESLGTGRANDGSYVFKTFSIPSTATKVRFMCECGAVSEKCYVDNVKVIAE